jgi:hypothetical protein
MTRILNEGSQIRICISVTNLNKNWQTLLSDVVLMR